MLRKTRLHVVVWMGLSGICLALLASPAAWADGNERELEAARERVQDMLRKAEALQDNGQRDRARELVTKAEALQKKIQAALKKRGDRERKPSKRAEGKEKNWHAVLRGLNHGIEALVELGLHEDAARLEEVRDGLAKRLEHRGRERRKQSEDEEARRRHAERKEHEAKKRHEERQILKRRLGIMAQAKPALREAERKNELEVLERGMHARELMLEGRRDKEAIRIIEKGPDREQLAEVMIFAGKLWREFGHPEKAEMCTKLGHELIGKKADRERRERAGHHERERKRERHERERKRERERDRPGSEDLLHRIEELQERIGHLQELIERLQHDMREVKRKR